MNDGRVRSLRGVTPQEVASDIMANAGDYEHMVSVCAMRGEGGNMGYLYSWSDMDYHVAMGLIACLEQHIAHVFRGGCE